MHRSAASAAWLSAHLFFEGDIYSQACDHVLLEVVEPFVRQGQKRKWLDRFFFVRYSERGSHVRLRLHGEPAVLYGAVKRALDRYVAGPAVGRACSEHKGLPEQAIKPSVSLQWVPYGPEIERYGGPAGVALAETVFHYSSEAGLSLLKDSLHQERPARLGKGLLAMVVALHAFCKRRDLAVTLARLYRTSIISLAANDKSQHSFWSKPLEESYARQAPKLLAYLNTLWEELDAASLSIGALGSYYRHLREVEERFVHLASRGRLQSNGVVLMNPEHAVCAIVPSYIHMMNNRLGIAVPEELYLAHLAMRALETEDHHHYSHER